MEISGIVVQLISLVSICQLVGHVVVMAVLKMNTA